MKRIFFLIVFSLCLIETNFASSIWTKGSGTETDPYLIASNDNLSYLAEMTNGGVSTYSGTYFKLTASFTTTAAIINNFSGFFDGGGYSITKSNFIFGTTNAKISNLKVVNGCIVQTLKGGTIDKCTSSGTMALNAGICQNLTSGTISNCVNTASCNKYYTTAGASGGICAKASGGYIKYCYNSGAITNSNYTSYNGSSSYVGYALAGGILGEGYSTIIYCYNTGTIKAVSEYSTSYAGGIVSQGASNGLYISSCYNVGNVSAKTDFAGICSGYAGGGYTTTSGAGTAEKAKGGTYKSPTVMITSVRLLGS